MSSDTLTEQDSHVLLRASNMWVPFAGRIVPKSAARHRGSIGALDADLPVEPLRPADEGLLPGGAALDEVVVEDFIGHHVPVEPDEGDLLVDQPGFVLAGIVQDVWVERSCARAAGRAGSRSGRARASSRGRPG